MSYYNQQQPQGPPPSENCQCGLLEAGPKMSGPNAKNPNELFYACSQPRNSQCKHFRFLRPELNRSRGGFGGRGGQYGGGGRGGAPSNGGGYGQNSGGGGVPQPSSNTPYAQFTTAPAPSEVPSFKRPREDEGSAGGRAPHGQQEGLIELRNAMSFEFIELQKNVTQLKSGQELLLQNLEELMGHIVALSKRQAKMEDMDQ